MRNIFICLLWFLATVNLQAQEKEYLSKVQTIDSTIKTLYKVISGEKGEARNWELFKYLFHQEAKLIPSGNNRQGVVGVRYMTTDDYIKTSGKWLEKNGFFENEIGRKIDRFGKEKPKSILFQRSTFTNF